MKTKIKPTKKFLLGCYPLLQFDLGRTVTDLGLPKMLDNGGPDSVQRLYSNEIQKFQNQIGLGYVPVPYSFVHSGIGDYTGVGAVEEFFRLQMEIESHLPHLSDVARHLWRTTMLLQDIRFTTMTPILAVRGFVPSPRLKLRIGIGLYADAAYSVNSDDLLIALSGALRRRKEETLEPKTFNELCRLVRGFERKYGKGQTVREILFQKHGRLSELGESYTHILGGAGMVLTEDGYVILVMRSSKTTLVNFGINVPTSGGADFNEGELRALGLPFYLIREILREAHEELGISGEFLVVHPLAFVRELTRGGTPDVLYLLEFQGSLQEAVSKIARNPHPGGNEIDRLVFALKLSDLRKIIIDPRVKSVLHHKALVTAIMIDRFMRARGQ